MRFLDTNPTQLQSQKGMQKSLEEDLEKQKNDKYWFTIRALDDDKLLGDIDLSIYNWTGRDAFVGLGIGERDFWGKGYGTDMMRLCLRYAFLELGLQRVSLGLHEYNPRALRLYEKAGFRLEGRTRGDLMREGKRYDTLWMGVLREEWLEQYGEQL